MMKKILIVSLIVLLSVGIVYGNGGHNLEEARELIESEIPCSQLTEEQLEHIGDYYMEQMHPNNHEAMDEMMGGEGSENLRLIHINMARAFYCGESDAMSSGMMDMMMGRGMRMMDTTNNLGGTKMMGNFNTFGWHWGFGIIYMIIFWGLIIWLIVWLVNKYSKPQIRRSESAVDILKKRYAKGELTKKQFEEMKKELM